MPVRLHRFTLGFLILAGAACGGGGGKTAPRTPAKIVTNAGSVVGAVNTPVSPQITFTVLDANNAAIPDVPVSFTITGGGTLTGSPTKSGSSAIPVGTWTLGPQLGQNTLTITVSGVAPAVVTAEARSAYSIDLRFVGPAPEAAVLTAFNSAKSRLEQIVTGDVPDVASTTYALTGNCALGSSGPTSITEAVDDVIIYAVVDSIDGPGKILGSAGPCYIREAGALPSLGLMHFDKFDLQTLVNDGRIGSTILHEMLHVLGFGTLWLQRGLINGAGTSNSAFTGPVATAQCQALGGGVVCAANVPLETTGGSGTRDSHWRETTFRDELMTGFIAGVGVTSPLSRISIGSLQDFGYTVALSLADPYTVPAASASVMAMGSAVESSALIMGERLILPIGKVDARGNITRIFR